jgi:hypothetical protein
MVIHGKFTLEANATQIKIDSQYLLVEWKTKICKRMFQLDSETNEKRLYIYCLGFRFEYGTTQINVSFNIHKAILISLGIIFSRHIHNIL